MATIGPTDMGNRNMLFLSHANPEDNLFTRWLSLRLAREGYPVWCDLTKLLGGEDFWRDAEAALRDRTAKFLFVLSKTSTQKQGTLDELALARRLGKQIQNFIIPLRVDDLPTDQINIELHRLAFIDFSKSWLAGYKQLIEALDKEQIPRDPRFTPDAVTQWWRKHYPAMEGVSDTPERCVSNWFEYSHLPDVIRMHSIHPPDRFEHAVEKELLEFTVPVRPHANFLFTFAKAEAVTKALADQGLEVDHTQELDFANFSSEGFKHPKIERRTARNIISSLFRGAFEQFAISKGLLPFELTGGAKFYWFKQGLVTNDKIFFTNPAGERGWRAMVGFKSLTAKEGEARIRNWHFGVQSRPYFWPCGHMSVRSHVAFTENGELYDSKAKQHSARRSQCKSWYNDDWLDRMLATMSFLAGDGSEEILIPLWDDQSLGVKRLPILFESPVSFKQVEEQPPVEEPSEEEEGEGASEEEDEEL